MKLKLLFNLALVIGFSSSVKSYSKSIDTLNSILQPYKIQFENGDRVPLVNNTKFLAKGQVFHTIIAEKQKIRIELEIIKPVSADFATAYQNSKYAIVNNLYAPQIIPYSGKLTSETDCPTDKKPEETETEILANPTKIIIANATERFVLGAWDDEQIKTKAAFTVVYDKENSAIYQIIIFMPALSFDREKVFEIFRGIKTVDSDSENISSQ